MKNKISFLLIVVILVFITLPSFSATSSTSRGSSTKTTRKDFRGEDEDERSKRREGCIKDFIVAVIGTKLRHPDPQIRMQALQSIIAGIISGEGEGDNNDEGGGLRSYFRIGNNEDDDDKNSYAGAGAAAFIPDMYSLLRDPDPEIRDTATVGLDALFGSDVTLLRFMDDPDPVIRKYATKIYTKKSFTTNKEDNNDDENGRSSDLLQLLALRTLLIRLKYETDEGVRKTIEDSIEYYLTTDTDNEGRNNERGYIKGVDMSIVKYLSDSNPDVRKNTAKIIGDLEYNPNILNVLLEALRKEEDPDVKTEIQSSIDKLVSNLKSQREEGRR